MSQSKKAKSICSTCRKPKPINCTTKTCDVCKKRSALFREKAKENKIECIAKKQNGIKCTNKVSNKCGNKYCEKHITEWKQYQETGGKNVKRCNSRTQCDPNKPGVKAILPNGYTKKKCENCLQRERLREKSIRDKKIGLNKKLEQKDSEYRICSECPIGNRYNIDEMGLRKNGTRSNLCKHHFEVAQKIEANRPKRDNKVSKEYESRPERKLKKKMWRKMNPDKVYKYYTSYRARQLQENPELYHKKCAENARKWRERHPEYLKKMIDKRKIDTNLAYRLYIYRSNRDGYEFKLTLTEFGKLVNGKCYYCSIPKRKYLLGIDRLDNSKGYIKNNIVTCCKICNIMKNTLNEATFILMCAHIAHINNIYRFELYPKVFNNYANRTFNDYKLSAKRRDIPFGISNKFFDKIKENPCYICKREPTNKHFYGIDRYDNSLGYIDSNCRACCGDCNYLKGKLNYDYFLFKCGFIALEHKDRLQYLENTWKPSNFTIKNKNKIKLSKEEKIEIKKQHNKKIHEKTMASKTTEAIEKQMAKIRLEKIVEF